MAEVIQLLTYAAIICHKDELSSSSSLTLLDCLQTDSEDFILLAESKVGH